MVRIAIDLPDFATLSDEAIQRHPLTRTRDGRWSRLTKSILNHLGTTRLNLNAAWADTWDQWVCPCCGRGKFEIARLSPAGVALCRLDWHHDHLDDLAKDIIRDFCRIGISDEPIISRSKTRGDLLALIIRFSETLLCADCNQAEGAMKSAVCKDVDPAFSFSPSEIATFIIVRPNASHQLRVNVGEEAFESANPIFQERVAFARLLAARLRDGHLNCEHTPRGGYQRGDDIEFIHQLVYEEAGKQSHRIKLANDLSLRSRATDGSGTSLRRARTNNPIAPTKEEFDALNTERLASPRWREVGEAWQCTICDRKKTEFARKSNQNRWTAGVQALSSFDVETDQRSIAFRSRREATDTVLGSHQTYFVCQDCRQIATEAAKLGGTADCLTPDDLRRLIAHPICNRSHETTPEDIRAALVANADWRRAVSDYWEHNRRATDLVAALRLFLARGYSEQGARQHLLDTYLAEKEDYPVRTSAEFDWLLEEGWRLAD